jgi:hypothetical protein
MKRTATVMIIALLAFGRVSTLSSHWRQVVADQGGDSGDDSGDDNGDDNSST